MYKPFRFEKEVCFDSIIKDDVEAIVENESSICFKMDGKIVATPTETEIKVVESKTGKNYAEYLAQFLLENSPENICKKYEIESEKDLPVYIAMAVFDSIL